MTRSILRWAVGSSDVPRSSAWRLWGDHKGDIYAAVRSLGGVTKVSFHRDGKCQVGFTSEYASTAAARFGKQARHWETWKLPQEPVARVLQILVPQSELRHFVGRDDARVVWLPPPPPADSVAAVSVLVAPPLAELVPPETSCAALVGTVRTNLRNAWVFYAICSIDAALCRAIAAQQTTLTRLPKPATILPGTRAVVWGFRPDDGCLQVLELAYEAG
jgi:hypothetical protein